jgi:phosphotriesterase-related protein
MHSYHLRTTTDETGTPRQADPHVADSTIGDVGGGLVETVLGPVPPSDLGLTLMHEHLLIDLTPPALRADAAAAGLDVRAEDCFKLTWGQYQVPANFVLHDHEVALAELAEFRAAGGSTLVDLTTGGLSPDPDGLVELSRRSGVHVVMGCGHYVHEYQDPANADRSVEGFAAEMVSQLTTGAWGTEVRAGIIGEIGCQSPWTDQERRVMRGALLAQSETGAALNAHPGRSPGQPFELVAAARAAGAPLDRFVISHLDRTLFEIDDFLRLADSGCVLELDLFGWETAHYFPNPAVDLPNDATRVRIIRALVDHGHLERILISQDVCTRSRLGRYGGHGYQHIPANVLPLMLRRGFDEDEIDTIIRRNPARLLTLAR